jgi:hypothetical protein
MLAWARLGERSWILKRRHLPVRIEHPVLGCKLKPEVCKQVGVLRETGET